MSNLKETAAMILADREAGDAAENRYWHRMAGAADQVLITNAQEKPEVPDDEC